MMISLFYGAENIVGKGENSGSPTFSPFPTMFSKGFFIWIDKVEIVWKRVKTSNCLV